MVRPPLPEIGKDSRTWGTKNNAVLGDLQESADAAQTAIASLRLGITRKNLKSEGLSLDGSNEGATFAAMAANDSAGTVYVIPDGATLGMGSTQLAITGKPHMRIEGYEGAKLQWSSVSSNPLVQITSSHHFGIDNVELVGAETSFVGANSGRYGVRISSSPDARLVNVKVSGTSRGAEIAQSDRAVVEDFDYTGFVAVGPEPALVNYHSGLLLTSVNDVQIMRIRAKNCGSALLGGDNVNRIEVTQLWARNTWDNAIYIGDGYGWKIVQPNIFNDVLTVNTTAIKAVGSEHLILAGHVENMGSGYILADAISDLGGGYGGRGSMLIGSTAKNCGASGIQIAKQNTLKARDFLVLGNTLEGCGAFGGPSSSLLVINGDYHTLAHNKVIRHLGTEPAYHLAGTLSVPLVGLRLTDETIRDVQMVTGGRGGFHAANVNQMRITDMTLDNILHGVSGPSWGMLLTGAMNSLITGTRVMGTAGTLANIRIGDAASTNNRIYDNPGVTISDAGTGTVKYGNGNGNPTVAANATDLATAIALVNDLKAKLQAQSVLG